MICFDRKTSTTGIFLGATGILVLYLFGIRFHNFFPIPLFFISIGLMIGTIIYQCLALNPKRYFAGIILLEIVITAFAFHLIPQAPTYGLYGSDAYFDLASLKGILESGYIRGIPEYVQLTSYFPMIHVLGAELSLVTGIDPFTVAKWFPSLLDIANVSMLYLLVRHIFEEEKVALLSALLLASLQHHIFFGSLFVRETIALTMMISCLYFYLSARTSQHPVVYRALAILCLAGTVLAHHFTSLMTVLILFIHWVVTNAAFLKVPGKWLKGETVAENVSLSFVLMALIGTFTYWTLVVIEPLHILAVFIQNIFKPSVWGTYTYLEQTSLSLPTFRYYVLIYGSYVFYLIFGLYLFFRLMPRGGNRHIEAYSFSIYLFICGLTGIAAFYILPATVSGDRFLTFGWLFAFGPLVLAILENRRFALRAFGVLSMIVFIFINMFTIHPTVWNPNAANSGAGGAAWEEDFALVKKMDFSKGEILGNLNNLMPIFNSQNKLGTDAFFLSNIIELEDYEWVIINRKGLTEEGLHTSYTLSAVSDMEKLLTGGSPSFNKTYESNNLAVFTKR